MKLELQNINIRIGDQIILDDASFYMQNGDVVLLEGSNGTGKSTILKSIVRDTNSIKEYSIAGSIKYNGIQLLEQKDIQWFKQKVCYIPQVDEFCCSSVWDEFLLVLEIIDKQNANKPYIQSFFEEKGINNIIKTSGIDLKKNPNQLSGGQKRLISILIGLLKTPNADLFIIDEPLNNLDFARVRDVSNLLTTIYRNSQNIGIIIVSHCKVFPIINRTVLLVDGQLKETNDLKCYACFGEPDKNGFYE